MYHSHFQFGCRSILIVTGPRKFFHRDIDGALNESVIGGIPTLRFAPTVSLSIHPYEYIRLVYLSQTHHEGRTSLTLSLCDTP